MGNGMRCDVPSNDVSRDRGMSGALCGGCKPSAGHSAGVRRCVWSTVVCVLARRDAGVFEWPRCDAALSDALAESRRGSGGDCGGRRA